MRVFIYGEFGLGDERLLFSAPDHVNDHLGNRDPVEFCIQKKAQRHSPLQRQGEADVVRRRVMRGSIVQQDKLPRHAKRWGGPHQEHATSRAVRLCAGLPSRPNVTRFAIWLSIIRKHASLPDVHELTPKALGEQFSRRRGRAGLPPRQARVRRMNTKSGSVARVEETALLCQP